MANQKADRDHGLLFDSHGLQYAALNFCVAESL